MDKKYEEYRKKIEQYFLDRNLVEGSIEKFCSPSGRYELTTEEYTTRKNAWSYTRGIVKEVSAGKIIADVKRNYSHFWHSWVQHSNGCEYLLCGEDYQGQTIINLTKGAVVNYFPKNGHNGAGFCWVDAHASPDSDFLAVEGCIWACPFEIVFFDFTEPDKLPYRELGRVDSLEKVSGWQGSNIFRLTREIEVRKSDGVPYDQLTNDEQDALDDGKEKSEYKIESVNVDLYELINNA